MPRYCPGCDQEYRDEVRRCADCDLELLEERLPGPRSTAAAPGGGEEAEVEEASMLVADLSTGEQLLQALLRHRCPAYLDEAEKDSVAPFRVAVPRELTPMAGQVLLRERHRFQVDQPEEGPAVYRLREADAAGEISRHSLLRLRATEVTHEDLPELLRLVDHGTMEVVGQAGLRLATLGAQALDELLTRVVRHAAEVPGEATVRALMALSGCRGQSLPPSYREHLCGATEPSLRRDLCRAAGIVRDGQVADLLVVALEDPDEEVRTEAIDALWAITGETLGFEPEAPAEDRRDALARWQERYLT
jgi:hypothetical protein